MSAAPSTSTGSSILKPPLTFEFTKRKRWADLLITELADVIILILSSTRKVLYCGTALTELLGWRDIDLIDGDLVDLVHPDDQVTFSTGFDESIRTSTELLSYVRLKCKNHTLACTPDVKEILFEIKGYPHVVPGEQPDPKCFFAMAKPYPSRNTAMLNTFLELKMENERLQQKVMDLRACVPKTPVPSNNAPSSSSAYSTSSMAARALPPPPMIIPSQRPTEPPNPWYDDVMPNPVRGSFDGNSYGGGNAYPSVSVPGIEEDGDDLSKKKKLKKSHTSELYVCITCGRTDSPEWRKGPLGPKTLCNACGLRWAKQMRKYDDPSEGGGEGSSAS